MIDFKIVDKRTRDKLGYVDALNQEEALQTAAQLWPSSRVEAIYPRPPLALTKEHTKLVRTRTRRCASNEKK